MSQNIDIRLQPRLGLGRIANLTMNGIRYRIFRSAVTMVVITVAIAFLMNGLCESLVKKALAEGTADRIRESRQATAWVARLSVPGTADSLLAALAEGDPNTIAELDSLGDLSSEQAAELQQAATRAQRYLDFFAGLGYGRRRQLVHNATGSAIFDYLQDAQRFAEFEQTLEATKSVRLVTTGDEFSAFLQDWPRYKGLLERILAGRRDAIAEIAGELGGRSPLLALRDVDGAFGETVRAAGFALPPEEAAVVASQARDLLLRRALEKSIARPIVKEEVARRLDKLPREVGVATLYDLLDQRGDTEWYLGILSVRLPVVASVPGDSTFVVEGDVARRFQAGDQVGLGPVDSAPAATLTVAGASYDAEADRTRIRVTGKLSGTAEGLVLGHSALQLGDLGEGATLDAAEAVRLANDKHTMDQLLRAARLGGGDSGGIMGIGKRMTWLLFVSLLVCAVGIANAMLMTVTERFREIATLKCLGALDGTIMVMFVLEAALLGLVGGALGTLLGGLLGLGRMTVAFGPQVFGAVQVGPLLAASGLALVVGVILASLAAVYPSLKAARLAPMEAMRIE